MRRRLFFLLLCLPMLANAQGWLSYKGTTATEPLFPNEGNFEKVRSFDDKYLVGLGKMQNGQFYFTLWDGNSLQYNYAFLSNSDEVYDFTIHEDLVYFCGKSGSITGGNVGFLGVFKIMDLISSSSFAYWITPVPETKSLGRLEVYSDYNTPSVTHIVAIGDPYPWQIPTQNSCLVCFDNSQTQTFGYKILGYPLGGTSGLEDILKDITITDKFVATVGYVPTTQGFMVRRFLRDDPEDLSYQEAYHYIYAFFIALTSDGYKIEWLTDNRIVTGFVGQGPNHTDASWFTFIDLDNMSTIEFARYIQHVDKRSELITMRYFAPEKLLLVLETAELPILGSLEQSVAYFYPYDPTPYTSFTKFLQTSSVLTDLTLVGDKYALTGVNLSLNNQQLFHTEDVTNMNFVCDTQFPIDVNSVSNCVVTQDNALPSILPFTPCNWITQTMYVNTNIMNLDCQD